MVTECKEREILYFKDLTITAFQDLFDLNQIEDGSIVTKVPHIARIETNLYGLEDLDNPSKIDLLGRGSSISASLPEGSQFALAINAELCEMELARLNTLSQPEKMIRKRSFLGTLARIDGVPIAHQFIAKGGIETLREKLIEMEPTDFEHKLSCSVFEQHSEYPDGKIDPENLVHLPRDSSAQIIDIIIVSALQTETLRKRFSNNGGVEVDFETVDITPIAAFSIKLASL